MKRIALPAVLILLSLARPVFAADLYRFDPLQTRVIWHENHFGFSDTTVGMFQIVSGTMLLDEKDPAQSSVKVTIDMNTLATGMNRFDDQVKSFLHVSKYPTAAFKSTEVKVDGHTAQVTGALTLNGVTKPVTLAMTLNKIGMNPLSQKNVAGFSGTTTLKRSDFGINNYIPSISDEVRLDIEAEAELVKKNASKADADVSPRPSAKPKKEEKEEKGSYSGKGSYSYSGGRW